MIPKADAGSREYKKDFPFIGRKNRKNSKIMTFPAVVNGKKITYHFNGTILDLHKSGTAELALIGI
jgi:hypothetical protein